MLGVVYWLMRSKSKETVLPDGLIERKTDIDGLGRAGHAAKGWKMKIQTARKQ